MDVSGGAAWGLLFGCLVFGGMVGYLLGVAQMGYMLARDGYQVQDKHIVPVDDPVFAEPMGEEE